MANKLPKSLTDALKTFDGCKAIAKRLFEETEQLKKSLKNTQDELENWRGKYHQADKEIGILGTKISRGALADVTKYIFSVIPAGVGINLITAKFNVGYWWLAGSLVIYIALTYLARGRSD